MNNLKILITLLLTCFLANSQTYDGDLILSSQEEIDTFEYTEVRRKLTIREYSPGSITNLNALSKLTLVKSIHISDNLQLKSLDGLQNLTTVGEVLKINNNNNLENIEALRNVEETFLSRGHYIIITGNPILKSLKGLEKITSLTRLIVNNNTELNDFCAVYNIDITPTRYRVSANAYNPTLEELTTTCNNPNVVANVLIKNQEEIDYFPYKNITGNLLIEEEAPASITNLYGLENITNIAGNLTIINNTLLNSYCGIKPVIENNFLQGSYTANNNLKNTTKEELLAEDCTIYTGDITLTTQEEIDAFAYTGIVGNLTINKSDSYSSNIINLNNLTILDSINGNLSITDLSNLNNFCGIKHLVENNKISGELTLTNNKYTPTKEGLIGYCENPYYVGSITFRTQQEIDNFSASYIGIDGSLTFNDTIGDITNIEALKNIEYINGGISIRSAIGLTSLEPLKKLTEIKSDLNIENTKLTNLEGLNNITNIVDNLYIANNTKLNSLQGLNKLKNVNTLRIINNPELINLQGLNSLEKIEGDFEINTIYFSTIHNEYRDELDLKLESLDGLESLTEIGDLTLLNCNVLENIDGLKNVHTINGSINIKDNKTLNNIDGFSSLANLTNNINISNNNNLINFCVLSTISNNITSEQYYIYSNGYNPTLTQLKQNNCSVIQGDHGNGTFGGSIIINNQVELDAFNYNNITGNLIINSNSVNNLKKLSSLTTTGGNLTILDTQINTLEGLDNLLTPNRITIKENINLTNLTALSNITETNYIYINNNTNLRHLEGLNNIVRVTGIFLENNLNLTNLTALSNITEAYSIFINNNSNLKSLQGLNNISSLVKYVTIRNNPLLNNLEGLNNISESKYFSVKFNSSLINLNGLDNLNSVDRLTIAGNNNIKSLQGLVNLTSVNKFYIYTNSNLKSLNGLISLNNVSSFDIRYNTNLENYCAITPLFEGETPPYISTRSNAIDINSYDFTNGNICLNNTLDDDNDGITNDKDICTNTPLGKSVYVDGCQIADSDNDGVLDDTDICANTPNGETVTEDGCSYNQKDDDNDGVLNAVDLCANTSIFDIVDQNGCTVTLSNNLIFKSFKNEVQLKINESNLSIEWNNFKSLTIYNTNGNLVKQSESNQTDVSEMASGIYVLELKGKHGEVYRMKIAK